MYFPSFHSRLKPVAFLKSKLTGCVSDDAGVAVEVLISLSIGDEESLVVLEETEGVELTSLDLPHPDSRDKRIADDNRIAVAFFMISSFTNLKFCIWIIPRIWGIVKK